MECGFEGKLSYPPIDFGPSDISYCPACGGDISESYVDEDDEESSIDSI
mgnify:FL=1